MGRSRSKSRDRNRNRRQKNSTSSSRRHCRSRSKSFSSDSDSSSKNEQTTSSSSYKYSRRSRSRPPEHRNKHRSGSMENKNEKEKTSEQLDGDKIIADTLATIALTRLNANVHVPQTDPNSSQRKKKSRWGGGAHEKIFIPGMPTILPSNLDKQQEQAYLLQLQIEEYSRRLRTGDLGIPTNPEERSPSPEPIYGSDGKRLNTREFRTRRRLEEERHNLVLKMQKINPEFKPPVDYKPPMIRVTDQVMIPQEDYPDINFVGLLIGPRGNTLKLMEKETGAKIIIRGRGSVKEGKVGRKDGHPLPGEDEPLHAYISATNSDSVRKAVARIKTIIQQGIETPEDKNHLRRMQLRELALLNGTLRESNGIKCSNCGATEHKTWMCPDKPNVTSNIVCTQCGAAGHIARDCLQKNKDADTAAVLKMDEEYMTLMAELSGETIVRPKCEIKNTTAIGIGIFQPAMVPKPLMPAPEPETDPAKAISPIIPHGVMDSSWTSGHMQWPAAMPTNILPTQHQGFPILNSPNQSILTWNRSAGVQIPYENVDVSSSNVAPPHTSVVASTSWPQYQQPVPTTWWHHYGNGSLHLPPPPPPGVDVKSFMYDPPPPPPKP